MYIVLFAEHLMATLTMCVLHYANVGEGKDSHCWNNYGRYDRSSCCPFTVAFLSFVPNVDRLVHSSVPHIVTPLYPPYLSLSLTHFTPFVISLPLSPSSLRPMFLTSPLS